MRFLKLRFIVREVPLYAETHTGKTVTCFMKFTHLYFAHRARIRIDTALGFKNVVHKCFSHFLRERKDALLFLK